MTIGSKLEKKIADLEKRIDFVERWMRAEVTPPTIDSMKARAANLANQTTPFVHRRTVVTGIGICKACGQDGVGPDVCHVCGARQT